MNINRQTNTYNMYETERPNVQYSDFIKLCQIKHTTSLKYSDIAHMLLLSIYLLL